MRSDTVTKGKQQAPHRSLFNALGMTKEEMDSYSNRAFDKAFRSYAFAWRGKKVLLRNWNIVNEKGKSI